MGRLRAKISNPEQATAELVAQACAAFKAPYDDRLGRAASMPTLRSVADSMDTSILRVRKLLITGNYFSTDIGRTVQEMAADGKSVEEIMTATGLGKASVYSYLPYKNTAFNLPADRRSSNADRNRAYRSRRKALSALKDESSSINLWRAIVLFQGYSFETSGRGDRAGVRFKYSVSSERGKSGKQYAGESVEGYGNELFIIGNDGVKRDKSITRSSVDYALNIALAGAVTGPKQLKVYGSSYIYAIFKRFMLV